MPTVYHARYPHLERLLKSYLHQDYSRLYPEWEDAVHDYLSDAPAEEWRMLHQEVVELSGQVKRAEIGEKELGELLGSMMEYWPGGKGLSYTAWIHALRGLIRTYEGKYRGLPAKSFIGTAGSDGPTTIARTKVGSRDVDGSQRRSSPRDKTQGSKSHPFRRAAGLVAGLALLWPLAALWRATTHSDAEPRQASHASLTPAENTRLTELAKSREEAARRDSLLAIAGRRLAVERVRADSIRRDSLALAEFLRDSATVQIDGIAYRADGWDEGPEINLTCYVTAWNTRDNPTNIWIKERSASSAVETNIYQNGVGTSVTAAGWSVTGYVDAYRLAPRSWTELRFYFTPYPRRIPPDVPITVGFVQVITSSRELPIPEGGQPASVRCPPAPGLRPKLDSLDLL
jgi:hypothetical protein